MKRPTSIALLAAPFLLAACNLVLGLENFSDENAKPVVCAPNEMRECTYLGPPATKGVGACRVGTQTCNADGTAFLPCVGQVLPKPEDCSTPDDDDCDGTPNQASAGCVCTPGMSEACYDGPSGTSNVGMCAAGMHACNKDGKGWGACTGEVLPQATDDCSNTADEDCSGSYCSQTMWASDVESSMGNGDFVAPWDASSDDAGNVYMIGSLLGTLQLTSPALSSPDPAIFVAKIDPSGQVAWAHLYSGPDDGFDTLVNGIATDGAGNSVSAGALGGVFTIGGSAYGHAPTEDGFLIKHDPSGKILWAKDLGDAAGQPAAEQAARAVAMDAAGDVVVAGTFAQSVDLGMGSMLAVGQQDLFVARYDKDGQPQYAKSFGTSGVQVDAQRVACDAAGNAIIAGITNGPVDFGNGFNIQPQVAGSPFLLRLDTNGGTAFGISLANGQQVTVNDVRFDSQGGVIAVGSFQGQLPSGNMYATVPHAGTNGFVAAFDVSGKSNWTLQIGTSVEPASGGTTTVMRVAIDDKDGLWLAGQCAGTVDLGASFDCGAGGMFVLKTDATGKVIWQRASQGMAVPSAAVYATPAFGFVAGVNQGQTDFGLGTLSSVSGHDLLLARFATR